MKKSILVASVLAIGTAGPAFAAGDETGGGVTTPDSGAKTTMMSSTAPEAGTEDMTLLEYFLALLAEWED